MRLRVCRRQEARMRNQLKAAVYLEFHVQTTANPTHAFVCLADEVRGTFPKDRRGYLKIYTDAEGVLQHLQEPVLWRFLRLLLVFVPGFLFPHISE